MSEINGRAGESQAPRSTGSRYSREAGVEKYRRKRRQIVVFRLVVSVLLVAILGGAAYLYGRQYIQGETEASSAAVGQYAEELQSEEITTVQPASATMVFTGDVVLNGQALDSGLQEGGSYNFSHIFAQVEKEISSYDLRVVSQESALPGRGATYGLLYPLNAPQDLGRAEVGAGFNVILRANDHVLDNGAEGIHNELAWWKSEFSQVPILGVSEPDPEKYTGLAHYVDDVYLFDKDGFKIAVLNHTSPFNVGEEQRAYLSVLDEQKIAHDVATARSLGADIVVACPHWGMENVVEPSEEERSFAQYYADQGVDLVVGNNPRVLQTAEVLTGVNGKRMPCFYSLGCLVCALNYQNLVGGLVEVKVERSDTGECRVAEATLKPVVTHRAQGEEFTVYLVDDYTDELAYSSWDPALTPQAANDMCQQLYGDSWDADAGELHLV